MEDKNITGFKGQFRLGGYQRWFFMASAVVSQTVHRLGQWGAIRWYAWAGTLLKRESNYAAKTRKINSKFLYLCCMNNRRVTTRMMDVLHKTLQEQAAKNLPLVYRNHLCQTNSQFIHLYPDGRTVLIQQNRENSTEKILKVL